MTNPTPNRIQLHRTPGWRKPADAITVARPTRWGNPFTIASAIEAGMVDPWDAPTEHRQFVTTVFDEWLTRGDNSSWWFNDGADQWQWITDHLGELTGRTLACWCPLDQPCHADVLTRLATARVTGPRVASRVVVCGGRNYSDRARVETIIADLATRTAGALTIAQGGAPGADQLTADVCRSAGIECITYFAQWDTYGRAAGPIRNQQMLDHFTPDQVVAFPGGTGTADTIARAQQAAIPVWEVGR